ncbi:MAG TPA: peptide-methionine (R)-S-oxide reductase MsrB [Tepidisphaeraceae bacterium]|jgi:peptide-methionine (R)-S-oxide reductase|nr:peptide-methionine (R)-S-oxide reductase MsrB [Tepidisphaeraceae bacterium]
MSRFIFAKLLTCLTIAAFVSIIGCEQPPKPTDEPAGATTRSAVADPRAVTDAQWRQRLTDNQYYILRQEGTEPPFRNALHDNKKPGVYRCAADGTLLFRSDEKYDSGTGWPSFWQPADQQAVTVVTDADGHRVEVECATCGGHLGHVFDDGPQPTGQRYCMNSGAMTFEAK